MSLEAVKQVADAEEQARLRKLLAQQEARGLIADAEREGQALLARAAADAKAENDALLAQAEQAAAAEIAAVRTRASQDAAQVRQKAEGRLEEAASLIVRKVVDA